MHIRMKIRKNWKTILTWLILGLILLGNTLHEQYPDEFDNILGGWFSIKGYGLYKEFFTHHNPLAYWISGLITLFTRQSLVLFRLGLAGFWWLTGLGFWKYFKKRFGEKISKTYLIWLFVYGIASTYFWTQMMLADSLAMFLYTPIALMMLVFLGGNKRITRKDVWLVGGLSFLVWLSSQGFTYLVALTNLLIWGKYLWQKRIKLFSKSNLVVLLGLAVPYLLFGSYLLLSGRAKDYYQQAIEFNIKYYLYNYPKPAGSMRVNPIRYVLITGDKIFFQYWVLLRMVAGLGLEYPINTTLALTMMGAITWGAVKKRWGWCLYLLGLIVLTNIRSEPLHSSERDYQIAVYAFSAMMVAVYWGQRLIRTFNQEKKLTRQLLWGGMLLSLLLYWTASGFRLVIKWEEKMYGKYRGAVPLVYDRPVIAPIINQLLTKDDYVWIGPFHFEEMFYVKAKPASKYTILLGEFKHLEEVQKKILADLEINQPKIISLDRNYRIRGGTPEENSQFFLKWLEKDYVLLGEYAKVESIGLTRNIYFAVDRDFYLRKDVAEEMVGKMEELGMIRVE